MGPVDSPPRSFMVGDWLVEPSLGRLSRAGASAQLELKLMEVLVCLAARAGELVTRRQIVDEVWATEFIADNTLTRAVAGLRRVLGDDARHPSYIETLHRRGYRLVAEVRGVLPPPPSPLTAPRFRLLTVEGEVEMAMGEHLIGRAPDAAVTVDSSKVSRRHARIVVGQDEAFLEDLGSKNGTFLNGERVHGRVRLGHGDEIRIGRNVARLRFVAVGEQTATEASVEHRT